MILTRSLIILSYLSPAVGSPGVGRKDVIIESFGSPPSHEWISINDPVMGGQSSGTFTIESSTDSNIGVFQGTVKDVPSLGAPGFIAARTPRTGSWFPDLSSCDGLKLRVKTPKPYDGYRLSFGTNSPAGAMRYARGYKAHFDVPEPLSEFHDIELGFSKFSDNWDPRTGDIIISCSEDEQFCPDDATRKNLQQIEIMAEGVNGDIKLEIDSISATNCDDDVVESDPNPEETAKTNGSSSGRGRGQFGGRNYSGEFGREENSVGGYGGYTYPTILPNGDIRIESFNSPKHRWFPLNDPVMGGSSTSSVAVKNNVGVFDGEVVDVARLDAPGFIKMETRGGNFPDVSMCKALKINLRSMTEYTGIRVTLGRHHADGAQPYVRGYKVHLKNVPTYDFGEVVVPFSDFSDNWDPRTGDIIVSCKTDKKHCVDHDTLVDFATFSFMGEGVDGEVHLEVKSIDATDCKHSAVEYQNADIFKGEGLSPMILTSAFVAFIVVGVLAFYAGKKYERQLGYTGPPSVVGGGISLPPSMDNAGSSLDGVIT
eukprot:CAMPEP_0181088344 /NCGR_PEP_ID=MMETSP1071-20121207/6736_1 /TAXON_ID=35127 /ORGANISM="Thalassiosira sp., Strain NH16" /LENGTH=540 /DNA_ID=CAMNT_0023170253 /DNA_START=54 /DNA_END=1676 /DNA_ORIENTATION=-